MPTVTSKRKYEQLKVSINGIPHLHIRLLELVGFQSWIHGEAEFFIEYYFKGGDKITTVYGNRDLWVEILTEVNSAITV